MKGTAVSSPKRSPVVPKNLKTGMLQALFNEENDGHENVNISRRLTGSNIICNIIKEQKKLSPKETFRSKPNLGDAEVDTNGESLNNNLSSVKSRNYSTLKIDLEPSKSSNYYKSPTKKSAAQTNACDLKSDLSSVRDVTLARTSTVEIEFIDAEEWSFESEEYDSKNSKTEDLNSTLGVKDLLNSLADSTNPSEDPENLLLCKQISSIEKSPLQSRNSTQELSSDFFKSNLKRKLSAREEVKNKVKKYLKFTVVTIFYFERSQGFSSIPSKGGATLGMASHHFFATTLPVEDYEVKKIPRTLSRTRSTNLLCQRIEKPKIEALSTVQRIELLQSSHVEIEQQEEEECELIRSSRIIAGCDCKDYCDPDVCSCHLAEIQCQVDRPNFPCSCCKEHCRNAAGRNEYDHFKVKNHFYKTLKRVKTEAKSKNPKRKQHSSPNTVT